MRRNAHLRGGRIAERALCIDSHPEWGPMYNVYKPKCAFLPGKTAFSGYLWWSIPKGRKTGNYRGPNSPRWLWVSPGAPGHSGPLWKILEAPKQFQSAPPNQQDGPLHTTV